MEVLEGQHLKEVRKAGESKKGHFLGQLMINANCFHVFTIFLHFRKSRRGKHSFHNLYDRSSSALAMQNLAL